MLRSVFRKSLRDRRWSLLWWAIGLFGLALYIAIFYPYIRDMPGLNELLQEVPAGLIKTLVGEITDLTSPQGYLNSELFFLIAPLLFLILSIGMASDVIAGEEERGTLDVLLSAPIPRWRVVLEKVAALTLSLVIVAFAFWLGLAMGAAWVEMDLSAGRLAEATLSGVLLALALGMLALAVGCVRGNRGLATSVASVVGVASYFLNALGPQVEVLKPYQKLSPFYYYIGASPLVNGLNLGHAMVLLGLAVFFLAVALIAFERRDLNT